MGASDYAKIASAPVVVAEATNTKPNNAINFNIPILIV